MDRKTKLAEGQAVGKALLDVEGRIRELLPSKLPSAGDRRSSDFQGKAEILKTSGVSKHQRLNAITIHEHPTEVAEVIQEAEENEDIPTKGAVLNKIALNKARECNDQAKQKHNTSLSILRTEEQIYLTDLLRAVNLISEPPMELTLLPQNEGLPPQSEEVINGLCFT